MTQEHLKQIGRIDVALAPVDGGFTLGQRGMIEVLKVLQPRIVIPMHSLGPSTLERFLDMARENWSVEYAGNPLLKLTREALPAATKVIVLPGR